MYICIYMLLIYRWYYIQDIHAMQESSTAVVSLCRTNRYYTAPTPTAAVCRVSEMYQMYLGHYSSRRSKSSSTTAAVLVCI